MSDDANNNPVAHFDILIVGAGLSGIGAACHYRRKCPNKSLAILEARDAIGGTWDLFRYPGIRSDSDMFTLGYNFRPWTAGEAIADGKAIREYVIDTAQEFGVAELIQFGQRVVRAQWSSTQARWTITAELGSGGERQFTCNFVHGCSGYYSYESGYEPDFAGREEFAGPVIHPQKWPEDLDYSGKKVVVIGSGATAVTLVPAMAEQADKVTMLQRSPSYVISLPKRDVLFNFLKRFLPISWLYRLIRGRNILLAMYLFVMSRKFPKLISNFLKGQIKKSLGDKFDMKHFSPSYQPWDERLCIVPDGDLFEAIKSGKADIVTDHIERFTSRGILLQSGQELEADIIVTATGLSIQVFGGAKIIVDDQPLQITEKMAYRGVMLEDVPNAGMTFGYTNASWTLKADLTSEYLCRLINYLDQNQFSSCLPRRRQGDEATDDFVDLQSGYVARAKDLLPMQGASVPWRLHQNYFFDLAMLRYSKIDDGVLEFSAKASAS